MENVKVLIIEDEPLIAMVLEIELRDCGFDVIGRSQDGATSMELLEINKPDVVLVDILLKNNECGIMLAEKIYKNYKIPIIFTSGNTDLLKIDKIKKLEFSFNYVTKPYDFELVIDAVEHVIDKQNLKNKKRKIEKKCIKKQIKMT